ncbi:hypothetical protein ACO0RG_001529 [Hanseniaspora osmophila]|uniref:Maintenance of telomere capping protein 4 n=1 Tax=Hanseniaspora osmophila TaxID=56408 RepID=A0A1E5R0N1_9ASCO|nr:hypothetical protein AWRI3579_g4541 [Hanseniaspora osmophila]
MGFHKSGTVVKLQGLNDLSAQDPRNNNSHKFAHDFLNIHSASTLAPRLHSHTVQSPDSTSASSYEDEYKSAHRVNQSSASSSSPSTSLQNKREGTEENELVVRPRRNNFMNGSAMHNDFTEEIAPSAGDDDNSEKAAAKSDKALLNAKSLTLWLVKNTKPQLLLDFNIDESSNAKKDYTNLSESAGLGSSLITDPKLRVQIVKVRNYLAHYYMLLDSTNGTYNPLKTMRNRKLQHQGMRANHRDTFRKTHAVTDPPAIPVLVFSRRNRPKDEINELGIDAVNENWEKKRAKKHYSEHEHRHYKESRTSRSHNPIHRRKGKNKGKYVFWKWFVGVNERYDDINWERVQVLRSQMNSSENIDDTEQPSPEILEDNEANFAHDAFQQYEEKVPADVEHVEDAGTSKDTLEQTEGNDKELSHGNTPPQVIVTDEKDHQQNLQRVLTGQNNNHEPLGATSETPMYSLSGTPRASQSALSNKTYSPNLLDIKLRPKHTRQGTSSSISSDINVDGSLSLTKSVSSSMDSEKEYLSSTKKKSQSPPALLEHVIIESNQSTIGQKCKEQSSFQHMKKLQYQEFQYFKSIQKILMVQHANMRLSYEKHIAKFDSYEYKKNQEKELAGDEKALRELRELEMIGTDKYSNYLPPSNDIEELIFTNDRILTEINTSLTLRLKMCGNATARYADSEDENGQSKIHKMRMFNKLCKSKDKIFYVIIEYVITLSFRMIWLVFVIFKGFLKVLGFS